MIEKNRKPCFTLLLSLVCLSVSSQSISEKTISLDPYLSFQNYEHFKRLTLSSPDSQIEFLENFDFEWGYRYQLLVKETKLAETLSDGKEYEYSYQGIVSKNRVADTTEFSLFIDPLRYYQIEESVEKELNYTLKQIDDSTYNYFDKVKLIIPSHLQSQMHQIIESKRGKSGIFHFLAADRIRLIRFK